MTVQVAYYREGKHWVAQALNVDVSTFGSSLEEAQSSIKEALELYFENEPEAPFMQIDTVQLDPHPSLRPQRLSTQPG